MIEVFRFYNYQIKEYMCIPWYRGTDDIWLGDGGDLLVWLLKADDSEECRITTMREV